MDVRYVEDFSGFQLAAYVSTMSAKLQTTAQKKVISKQATELAKEVRRQIKAADMRWSRARTREARRSLREKGIRPLQKTIVTKSFKTRNKNIVGKVVGAKWPQGAHSHLVERGFRHPKSGRHTVAHRYQQKAVARVRMNMESIAVGELKKWMRSL